MTIGVAVLFFRFSLFARDAILFLVFVRLNRLTAHSTVAERKINFIRIISSKHDLHIVDSRVFRFVEFFSSFSLHLKFANLLLVFIVTIRRYISLFGSLCIIYFVINKYMCTRRHWIVSSRIQPKYMFVHVTFRVCMCGCESVLCGCWSRGTGCSQGHRERWYDTSARSLWKINT